MAKVSRGNMTVSGKLGKEVYVHTRFGEHVRRAVKPGIKKNEAALKAQYARTSYLNTLAGSINTLVKEHCPILKPGDFYERIQSLLRKEPLNNRFLLLKKLIGMEVHPGHPYPPNESHGLFVKQTAKRLTISIKVLSHPLYSKREADCYYYVPVLITWPEKGKPDIDAQFSEWININSKKPEFEFIFPVYPQTQHWLLGLQVIGGKNNRPLDLKWAEGMKLIEAGTFNVEDIKLMKEREKEKKIAVRNANKEDVVRVKAKR